MGSTVIHRKRSATIVTNVHILMDTGTRLLRYRLRDTRGDLFAEREMRSERLVREEKDDGIDGVIDHGDKRGRSADRVGVL